MQDLCKGITAIWVPKWAITARFDCQRARENGKIGNIPSQINLIGPKKSSIYNYIWSMQLHVLLEDLPSIQLGSQWGVKLLLRIEIYIYIYIFRTWALPIWPVLVEVFSLFNTTSCTLHKKTCYLHTSIPQVLFQVCHCSCSVHLRASSMHKDVSHKLFAFICLSIWLSCLTIEPCLSCGQGSTDSGSSVDLKSITAGGMIWGFAVRTNYLVGVSAKQIPSTD